MNTDDSRALCAEPQAIGQAYRPTARLFCGDCLETLSYQPSNSIDAIVTDPPYALVSITKRFGKPGAAPARVPAGGSGAYARASSGFMGQTWDTGETAFSVEFWQEAYRVLKPGGHVLAFGGTRTAHRLTCAIEDAGFEIRDMIAWLYGTGFPKSHNLDGAWEGWGTALKPALEPITVARKPLIGTMAANVLAYGVGPLNIDGCRAGLEGKQDHWDKYDPSAKIGFGGGEGERAGGAYNTKGRWPANVIHDGSAEVESAFAVYGESTSKASSRGELADIRGGKFNAAQERIAGTNTVRGHSDSGSAARFFYSAKASKADRGEGNNHPTVKPTNLMRYLCRLVTPPGGTVLDPFMGSGSTGKAALAEGFHFIGIEREQAYFDIARGRIVVPGPSVSSAPSAGIAPEQDIFA